MVKPVFYLFAIDSSLRRLSVRQARVTSRKSRGQMCSLPATSIARKWYKMLQITEERLRLTLLAISFRVASDFPFFSGGRWSPFFLVAGDRLFSCARSFRFFRVPVYSQEKESAINVEGDPDPKGVKLVHFPSQNILHKTLQNHGFLKVYVK